MRDIDTAILSADQFEAMRLCDVEDLDQEQAGQKMGVSRGTVQRLLYSGRKQLLEAMVNNSALIVNLRKSEVNDAIVHTDQRRRRTRRYRV